MTKFSMQEFGRKIKDRRIQFGMTQHNLAKGVGCSVSQICDVERGRSTPSLKRTVKLADYLRISLDEMVGLTYKNHLIEEVSNLPKDPLQEKIESLSPEKRIRLEGYLDCLLNE